MSGTVTFSPATLARSIEDRQARLAFVDGQFAAVLVRLDHEAHEELKGAWVLEFGVGRFDVFPCPTFASLDDAERWMMSLAADDGHAPGASSVASSR